MADTPAGATKRAPGVAQPKVKQRTDSVGKQSSLSVIMGSRNSRSTAAASSSTVKFEGSAVKLALSKLKLRASKKSRMMHVSWCRKMKSQDSGDRPRERSRTESGELAQEAFQRYFASTRGVSSFSQDLIWEALADMGIKARTRAEKIAVKRSAGHFEEGQKLSFNEFLNIADDARVKMRTARLNRVLQSFRAMKVSKDVVTPAQLYQVLDAMGLGSKIGTLERDTADVLISDLRADGNVNLHQYTIEEAETLVQRVRERVEVRARQKEREIKEDDALPAEIFNDFRGQLIDLHNGFEEMCPEGEDGLEGEETIQLLGEFGCVICQADGSRPEAEGLIRHYSQHLDGLVDFSVFLRIFRGVRHMQMLHSCQAVRALFAGYDRDRSGELDTSEVCRLFVELGLSPKNLCEQDGIAQLMEEVDENGTGTFSCDEFCFLVQRATEKLAQIQRDAENKKAEQLKFTRMQTHLLRSAFDILDDDCSGTLTLSECERAVHHIGWRISPARLQRLLDEYGHDDEGPGMGLSFVEFLGFMRHVEDEMRATSESIAGQQSAADIEEREKKKALAQEQARGSAEADLAAVAEDRGNGERRSRAANVVDRTRTERNPRRAAGGGAPKSSDRTRGGAGSTMSILRAERQSIMK